MSTPHNMAKVGEIASVCLMPGDPLRAQYIAQTYLENPVCFNTVRGMLGYTGLYKGKAVSVMGHGMGIASVGIYSYELYNFYNVETIIRVGSLGGLDASLHLGDVLLAQGACTDSNYAHQYGLPGTFAPIADFDLLYKSATLAKERGLGVAVGNVISSDVFYQVNPAMTNAWRTMGVLGVEMECSALYMNAAYAKKKALGMLTVSDIIGGDATQQMTPEQRQTTFDAMITLALDVAIAE